MTQFYSFFSAKHSPSIASRLYLLAGILTVTSLPAAAQQCSPISTLSCPAVVKSLPYEINFSGSEGGLTDKSAIATGFTMVDRPSAPLVTPTIPNIPGYEPSNLQVTGGKLFINTTSGISYLNPAQSSRTNSQVNALGAGFNAPAKFTIQTTLVQPNAGSGKSEQAGLWFGLDEDNYIKLVVQSAGGGASKIEMRKEVGVASTSADVKTTGSITVSSSIVRLKFLIDKLAGNAEGFYSLNSGAEVSVGTLSIPQSFTTGKTLSDGVTQNITFAGVFATHRSASVPITFSFEDFRIQNTQINTLEFDSIQWSTAASQPYNVNESQGKVVNGILYSFGGFDSRKSCCTPTKRAYMYNPVTDTWSAIADLPYTPNGANFGGVTHAGIATNGTDIFFAGGYTSNASGTGQMFGTKQVWKYIVAQNTYVRLPDLPITISAGQLEHLNGKLHYIGGTNASRTVDIGDHYVLDLNNLNLGWQTLALLPNPRQHAGSVVFGGKIYFIGGQHHHDAALMTQKDVHIYDPVSNTWTKMADLPVPPGANGRGHISSGVVVLGERIIVIGGETKHGTSTNLVSAYSPVSNSWKNLTPLPQNRYSGVAGNLLENLYYFAGSNSKITYKGIPVYDEEECSPLSSLSCPEIVKSLPVALNFDGIEGGLRDRSGVSTGFTMVDNPSTPQVTPTFSNIPGYEPSKLEISAGKLNITTITGIAHLNRAQSSGTNSQVNALGVGFVTPSQFSIQSTLANPAAGTGKSEQGGLWFGLDEDNYVKFVVLSTGNGNSKIEMRKEVAAMSATTDAKGSASMLLSSSLVNLKLVVNKVTNIVEGFYSINGGTEVSVGTLSIPSSFTAGKTLSDGITQNIVFGGVFGTHRSATTPVTYSFEDLKIQADINGISLKPETLGFKNTLPVIFSSHNPEKPVIYPNPVRERFILLLPEKYKGFNNLQVIDQMGKIFNPNKTSAHLKSYGFKVDLSKLLLKPGVYTLKVFSRNGEIESQKFVIL